MERKFRCYNFEILRIVLMILVIAGHMIMYCGKLDDIGTLEYFITNFLRSFTMVAVNSFVLISGYFSIKLNWYKLLWLDIHVCVYTWIGFILSIIFSIHKINLIKDVQFLFPIITKQYWFITIYFVLCILSPYINLFLRNVSKVMLKKALCSGAILFYIVATICFLINANQIVLDAGYGIVNFIYLYCLGYYIRHYYTDKYKTKVYLIIYILSCFFTFLVNLGMTYVTGFYFESMISYNTIFTLIGSVGLFMVFKNFNTINICPKKRKIILWLSNHSLSVYLIHMCPLIGFYIFTGVLKVQMFDVNHLIISFLILPIIIYLVCSILDVVVDLIIISVVKGLKYIFKCNRRNFPTFFS